MSPHKETRGRPRTFEDPQTTPIKHERSDRHAWQEAAEARSLSLNAWMNEVLNQAAKAEQIKKSVD